MGILALPHSSGADEPRTWVYFFFARWRIVIVSFRDVGHAGLLVTMTATAEESVPVVALSRSQATVRAYTLNTSRMRSILR